MIRSLWTAATGMQAQTLNIDVISNNLANVNTNGYKRSRAEFQDLLYETIRPAGAPASQNTRVPAGIQVGHGARSAAVKKIFTLGNMEKTENKLDVAIEGHGFFQVINANGDIAYTRAGAFQLDEEGRMVTADGLLIEPEVTVPLDAIDMVIDLDGTVSVLQPGSPEYAQIGNIELARFINPPGLKSIGRNLYLETTASGAPTIGNPGEDGFGTLAQGYLEMSNVRVVDEMVKMITAQRAYETNSKAIQASDEMLQMANNLKR